MEMTEKCFAAIYEKLVPKSKTYVDAYETVEIMHQEVFGKRRYSDYNSFRNVRNKAIKKTI